MKSIIISLFIICLSSCCTGKHKFETDIDIIDLPLGEDCSGYVVLLNNNDYCFRYSRSGTCKSSSITDFQLGYKLFLKKYQDQITQRTGKIIIDYDDSLVISQTYIDYFVDQTNELFHKASFEGKEGARITLILNE